MQDSNAREVIRMLSIVKTLNGNVSDDIKDGLKRNFRAAVVSEDLPGLLEIIEEIARLLQFADGDFSHRMAKRLQRMLQEAASAVARSSPVRILALA